MHAEAAKAAPSRAAYHRQWREARGSRAFVPPVASQADYWVNVVEQADDEWRSLVAVAEEQIQPVIHWLTRWHRSGVSWRRLAMLMAGQPHSWVIRGLENVRQCPQCGRWWRLERSPGCPRCASKAGEGLAAHPPGRAGD